MKILKTISIFILLNFLSINVLNASSSIVLKNNKESILSLGMEMSNMRNILKSYIQIGAKISHGNPTQTLKDGIVHYENLLEALKIKYPNNPTIQESIKTSKVAWVEVKKAMELSLTDISLEEMKKGAIFIHGNIRTVIKELALMKKDLLQSSDISNKEALNASMEIAASAHRLSAHYMMDLWHLDDPTIDKHWNKGLKIYADSIEILQNSPYIENQEFKELLQNCKKRHVYFTKMGKKARIYSILIDRKATIVFNNAKRMTQIILESNN